MPSAVLGASVPARFPDLYKLDQPKEIEAFADQPTVIAGAEEGGIEGEVMLPPGLEPRTLDSWAWTCVAVRTR